MRNFFPVKFRCAERENCTRYVSRWMLPCFVYKVDHSPAKVAARDMRFNCLTQLRSVAVESCPGFGNGSTPSARLSSQLALTAIYFIDFYSQKNIMSFCVFFSPFFLFFRRTTKLRKFSGFWLTFAMGIVGCPFKIVRCNFA